MANSGQAYLLPDSVRIRRRQRAHHKFGWAGEFVCHGTRRDAASSCKWAVMGSFLVTVCAYERGPEHWRWLSAAVSLSALPLAIAHVSAGIAALAAGEGLVERSNDVLNAIARFSWQAASAGNDAAQPQWPRRW